MRREKFVAYVFCLLLLSACRDERLLSAPPGPTSTRQSAPTITTSQAESVTPGVPETIAALLTPTTAAIVDDGAYTSLTVPLVRRTGQPAARVETISDDAFSLVTGDYQLNFGRGTLGNALTMTRTGNPLGLQLHLLGADLDLMQYVQQVSSLEDEDRSGVQLAGSAPWAEFTVWLWVYSFNPGLIHYRLELTPTSAFPSGRVDPEWIFVVAATGEAAPGGYTAYAETATFAAPSIYGYSEALDSTLLYWVDRTRLNPFIQVAHYSPAGTPVRRGHRLGHNLNLSDLQRLPLSQPWALYDSYLYLAPGAPDDEASMFLRYLHQVSDIYDLIARPVDDLPDWQALAQDTLKDLDDPDTWVELNGKRYWRAYVSDTRQTAEAITQLDIALGVARFAARFGADGLTKPLLEDVLATLPDFYNPAYELIQNSGPLTITGNQTRGDSWYELGHALKSAELGLLGYEVGADLARESQNAWLTFGQTVDHKFPQFYSFETWKGSGREPDVAGGYALYMLRMSELGCGQPCLQEAEAAVRALPGYGFAFAYETHMTAMAALAAAELADQTGDDSWLAYSYGPIANLIRLSRIFEADYGPAAPARTFFGLAPTQRAGVVTPKEQYEAWVYLNEFLRRVHGRLDPSVEKLVAEFRHHTLITLTDSLPPRLPAGVATEHPAAYATVGANRLDLHIPLEDMGDSWDIWGAIGQQVYGAGMAPTFAALAYEEAAPGVTVYSGYLLAKVEGLTMTFTGVPGTYAPASVSGISTILDSAGNPVDVTACGKALCFQVEGGGTYQWQP